MSKSARRLRGGRRGFHKLILRASGNPFMHSIAAPISTALSASFALGAPPPHPAAGSLIKREHLAIVEAIAGRDAQGASDAMMTVIRRASTTYPGFGSAEVSRLAILMFHQG